MYHLFAATDIDNRSYQLKAFLRLFSLSRFHLFGRFLCDKIFRLIHHHPTKETTEIWKQ